MQGQCHLSVNESMVDKQEKRVAPRLRLVNGTRSLTPHVIVPASKGAPPADSQASYATISHTLPLELTEHLRAFAHYQRVSASAVIEFALIALFKTRNDETLGATLRRKGAGPRRNPSSY